ncbi:MAG: hypothetical protein ACLGIR_14500 [Actinomycetes bacterium]
MAITSTSYLGQFTDENAETIAGRLEDAGITWFHKSSGSFMRTIFAADWGVRLFVDSDRLDDALAIARDVAPAGVASEHRRR